MKLHALTQATHSYVLLTAFITPGHSKIEFKIHCSDVTTITTFNYLCIPSQHLHACTCICTFTHSHMHPSPFPTHTHAHIPTRTTLASRGVRGLPRRPHPVQRDNHHQRPHQVYRGPHCLHCRSVAMTASLVATVAITASLPFLFLLPNPSFPLLPLPSSPQMSAPSFSLT